MATTNTFIETRFRWSKSVIFTTIFLLAMIALAAILLLWIEQRPQRTAMPDGFVIGLSAVMLFAPVLTALFIPRYLRADATNGHIEMKKVVGSLTISMENVTEITEVDAKDVKNAARTFGSGGLYGYFGQFRNKKLGKFTLYATEMQGLVVVKTRDGHKSKNYVFSCTDPGEFIAVVKAAIKPRTDEQ